MAKRIGNRLIQSRAADAGRAQARQATAWLEREQAQRGVLPLSAIQPRPGGDSRPLKPTHVLELAESIAAVGLIEPPVVDRHGCLLTGAHRVAALRLLTSASREARVRLWQQLANVEGAKLTVTRQAQLERLTAIDTIENQEVPVMILPFSAAEDPARALAIETSENTQRRAYSKEEILSLVQRLRKAGFVEREGRPRLREKALRPALSIIVGKSPNTIRRWLGVLNDAPKTCPNGQVFLVQQAEQRLRIAIKRYRQMASQYPEAVNQDLLDCLDTAESLLQPQAQGI